jgi:hypothetical protein
MPFAVMLMPTTASPGKPRYDSAVHDAIVRQGGKPAADGVSFQTTEGEDFNLNGGDFYLSRLSPSLCRIIFSAAQGTNSWIGTPSGPFLKAEGSVGKLPDYGSIAGLAPDPEVASEHAVTIVDPAALCGRLQSQLVEWNRSIRRLQAAGLMDAEERPLTPPADPGAEERLTSDPSGVATRCAAMEAAEQRALKERVLSIVISRNAEWGVIWRADVVSANFADIVSRQVCALQPGKEQALLFEDLPLDALDPKSAVAPLDPHEMPSAK